MIMGELTFEEINRVVIHLLKSIQLETCGSNPNHLMNLQIVESLRHHLLHCQGTQYILEQHTK